MSNLGVNIALIAVFIVIGGVFSAAEMALVSLREAQVKQLSTRGARGRKVADLSANPNRFLSAIQIGITFSGFLSASFGGATLSDDLAPLIARLRLPLGAARVIALVLVTLVISYFSIVLGELAAKRLAMQRAESFALHLAGLVDVIARLARPVIWFLGVSTDLIVRLLGGDPKAAREEVTDDELRTMVTGAASLGAEERHIVDEVFAAGERSLREVMVPRTEAEFLDGATPAYKALAKIEAAAHSRYPVTGESVDDILGFLHVRDLMNLDPEARRAPISQLARPVASLPDTVKVLHALTDMRRQSSHLAIVRDEYGGTAGLVTLEDLVEELVGEIRDEYDAAEVSARPGDMDGLTTLEQFEDLTGYRLPEGPYDTLAGFWVARRGALPEVGAQVQVELARGGAEPASVDLTVTEMDGRRAARIAVCPTASVPPAA
ncbi:MAG: hemolysin family protein [Propionibacteriaceae bacterium]|jgi:putative hemolysin|nr:hemolysin family protein [Propionibacteriaceae bacterium]